MQAPGGLTELNADGMAAWDAQLAMAMDEATKKGRPKALADDPGALPDVRTPDWPGFPARVSACLGRERTMRVLDWRPQGQGDLGRFRHQEEYLEWRVVRGADEVIEAVEMTSEFAAYWEALATAQPERLQELVSDLTGSQVQAEELYSGQDPAGLDPEQRAAAFRRGMGGLRAPPTSPLNDGREGICFLIMGENSLGALIELAVSAAHPFVVRDPLSGRPRYASGSEAIVGVGAVAQDRRNSDALVVERVTALVSSGQHIHFDDPIGVYIRGLQAHELAMPDGSSIDASWLTFSRGLSASDAADGRPRHQRLRITAPAGSTVRLGDLRIRRTGEPLRFGGQLAALTEQVVYLRSGPTDSAAEIAVSKAPGPRAPNCTDEEQSLAELQEANGG